MLYKADLLRFKTRHNIRQLDIQSVYVWVKIRLLQHCSMRNSIHWFERLSDSNIATRYGSTSNTPSISQTGWFREWWEWQWRQAKEKIQTSQAMETVDVLLNCEQENFDFHDIMNLIKIRSEVRKIVSNHKKLKTDYFIF